MTRSEDSEHGAHQGCRLVSRGVLSIMCTSFPYQETPSAAHRVETIGARPRECVLFGASRNRQRSESLVTSGLRPAYSTLAMGACCGKSSTSDGDHFATPGRTLGDAPPSQPASSSVPRIANASPGRTLGASSSAAGDDPKTAAARAAEVRTSDMPLKPTSRPPAPMIMSKHM